MITLAIDPGLMTGIAIWSGFHDKPYVTEIYGRKEFYLWLREWFNNIYKDDGVEIVIEEYQITQRTGELSKQYDALYIVGAVEALCTHMNIRFFMQSRSVKSFGTDAKLKYLGWYNPSKGGHQNDAQRHLLRHLVVNGNEALLKRLGEMLDG